MPCGFRGSGERRHGRVVLAHKLSHSTQPIIAEHAWMRDSPWYERQDLASIFVDTKHSRRAAETNLFQMAQQ